MLLAKTVPGLHSIKTQTCNPNRFVFYDFGNSYFRTEQARCSAY